MGAIVFIGASRTGSSMEALAAAYRLGYTVILMTDRRAFLRWPLEDVQLMYMQSMEEEMIRQELVQLIQSGRGIEAIISFVDPYVSMAARLSNELCGSVISSDALQLMEDKLTTRLALRNNRASCHFGIVSSTDSRQTAFTYPFIMKNPVSNGSKDVYYIENEESYELAVKRLTNRSPGKQFLAEEFIEGPQYVIEVVVVDTFPIIVAIIQQEISKDYTFIVTAYDVVMDMDESIYRSLWQTVTEIIRDIDLHHGACHFEMRLSQDGWKLIELNPRISGGAMNRMIEEAYGINLVQETIKLYLGAEPDLIRRKQLPVHTSFITINSTGYLVEIDGVKQAVLCTGVVDVQVKPSIGSIMMPPLSMGHRYGYVMAVGESSEAAKERAEHAVELITFYLEPF